MSHMPQTHTYMCAHTFPTLVLVLSPGIHKQEKKNEFVHPVWLTSIKAKHKCLHLTADVETHPRLSLTHSYLHHQQETIGI